MENQGISTTKKPRRNTKSQTHSKKTINNDYNDSYDEYSSKKRETKSHKNVIKNKNAKNYSDYSDNESEEKQITTKKSNIKKNETNRKSKNLIRSKHHNYSDNDSNYEPKKSSKKPKSSTKTKNSEEIDQIPLRTKKSNSVRRSTKYDSSEYENENRQQKQKKKPKNRHNYSDYYYSDYYTYSYYDYESDEKQRKNHEQIKSKRDFKDKYADDQKKSRSKSDVLHHKKKSKEEDEKEEERIPKKKRSQSSAGRKNNDYIQTMTKGSKQTKKIDQKEKENEKKQSKTKRDDKNDDENEFKSKRIPKSTKKIEEENKNDENESKTKKSSRKEKHNLNEDQEPINEEEKSSKTQNSSRKAKHNLNEDQEPTNEEEKSSKTQNSSRKAKHNLNEDQEPTNEEEKSSKARNSSRKDKQNSNKDQEPMKEEEKSPKTRKTSKTYKQNSDEDQEPIKNEEKSPKSRNSSKKVKQNSDGDHEIKDEEKITNTRKSHKEAKKDEKGNKVPIKEEETITRSRKSSKATKKNEEENKIDNTEEETDLKTRKSSKATNQNENTDQTPIKEKTVTRTRKSSNTAKQDSDEDQTPIKEEEKSPRKRKLSKTTEQNQDEDQQPIKEEETRTNKRKSSKAAKQNENEDQQSIKEENTGSKTRKVSQTTKEEESKSKTRKSSKASKQNEGEDQKPTKEEGTRSNTRKSSKVAKQNEDENQKPIKEEENTVSKTRKVSQTTKEEETKSKTRKSSKSSKQNEEEDQAPVKEEEKTVSKTRKVSQTDKQNEDEDQQPTKEEADPKTQEASKSKNKNNEENKNKDDETIQNNDSIESAKTKSSEKDKIETQKDDNHIITEETCPFIGLSNLGATCYMNSAIQVLFHTPLFRKNVLMYDTGIKNVDDLNVKNDPASKSKRILFNLQYLFYQMSECMKQQSNHKRHKDYISTAPLTKSFGWNQQEVSLQQDVHEFIINFFEVLDTCTKDPNIGNNDDDDDDSSITGLFKGRNITTITNKKDGKLILHSFESFYDFSLLVKGNKDIYQSLNSFTEKDDLTNDSNDHQQIQVQFYSLPKVLHIHLRRFVYSQDRCRTDKVNDYFSFPDELDMSPYVFAGDPKDIKKKKVKKTEQEEVFPYKGECNYSLYGVIVHQGKMSYVGHYYAYMKLNPDFNNENYNYDAKEDNWYLFNDTKVSKVTKEEATNLNFGCKNLESYDDSDFHCAYILLYVRNDVINDVFNIKNSDIKIPNNVMNCINSINNKGSNNKNQISSNNFTNVCTNATVGFTLITEDCIRMNCKLGKAGIDNRSLSKRVNVPFDQIFTFNQNGTDFIQIGGLYATIAVFLNVDLFRIRLWTVTSCYEIGEQLNRLDFEITQDMPSEEVEQIKDKATTKINPHVIFVEILPFDSYMADENEETEETEESSSVTKHHHSTSFITKLYTRENQCPMLYTGILTNISYNHTVNSLIKHHYKKQLLEISASNAKDRKACKELIDKLSIDVYYEKKRSNVKGDADLFKLNPTQSLKNNKVPKGSFLIFSINESAPETNNKQQIAGQEMIIRLVNNLIVKDKSLHNNYDFKADNKKNNSSSVAINRYCDMRDCPSNPIDFCNLFTNTETFDVYRYEDNLFFGKVELPVKLSINNLTDFVSFVFNQEKTKETKMLFFGDGPELRPIEAMHSSSSINDSTIFHLSENFKKSFFFDIVPKSFQYSDTCFTVSVIFSADSISITKRFNFFVETFSMDQEEIEETNQKQTKNKTVKKENQEINSATFDDILKKTIDIYESGLNPTKNRKPITLNDLRCFWVSKETSQIVSDFIPINQKKKKIYINERDILMNRELRIEVIPKEQVKGMTSIIKNKIKSKNNNDDFSSIRLEVYKSYVQANFDDDDGNNDSQSILKVFDLPFVLVNVEPEMKVKKLKEMISHVLSNGNENNEKTDYLSIKYATLFMPKIEKNLFGADQYDSSEDDEEEEIESKMKKTLIKDDYTFAFDANLILKNDEKVVLSKNQPNKLFLVYNEDRALGSANAGVVFFK